MIQWNLDLSLITRNNIKLADTIPNKDYRCDISIKKLNEIYGILDELPKI